MSLKYAILGLLNIVPMTGYDLKHQAFDETVRYFWPAHQGQIYQTLGELADEGLVTVAVEQQDDRPNRKVYTITEAGKASLMAWLKANHAPPTLRDPLLVQLFFGQEVPRADLLAVLDAQLENHRNQQLAYESIPIPPRETRPNDRWLALQHLTLDFGLTLEKAYVDWLERCRQEVAALPEPDEADDFRATIVPPGHS
jgi:DNA-binding PadR family transcriptional regulator